MSIAPPGHVVSWVGWGGSHPIDALPMGIDGPHFHSTSLCPHSSGSLVVEQLLPLKDRGEIEGPHCEFVFGNYTLLHHIDLHISYVHTFFIPHVTP